MVHTRLNYLVHTLPYILMEGSDIDMNINNVTLRNVHYMNNVIGGTLTSYAGKTH